jgi:hypothetical protein
MTDENCCRASARDAALASQVGFTDFPVPWLLKPELGTGGQPGARQLILAQIQRLKVEVSALKALVEQMPE